MNTEIGATDVKQLLRICIDMKDFYFCFKKILTDTR